MGMDGRKWAINPIRRCEDAIIELFLSTYDDDAWKHARITPLDKLMDGAVEALAMRPDGKTLAIEHTLIESFVGEREDLERFKAFLPIEDDPALRQSDRIVYVNVPRGALPKGTPWDPIVTCVHRWLLANLANLDADDDYQCCDFPIAGPGIAVPFEMKLQIARRDHGVSARGVDLEVARRSRGGHARESTGARQCPRLRSTSTRTAPAISVTMPGGRPNV